MKTHMIKYTKEELEKINKGLPLEERLLSTSPDLKEIVIIVIF